MVEPTGVLDSHNILKVPIAMVGSWAHPRYGKVAFTGEDLDTAITNFEMGVLGFEPHLTFGHLDEEPNSTDSARKRGNLKYLMRDGDTLDGYFKVPPGTAEAVADGEYEYSSGEFIRDFMDKVSGKSRGMVISRVALTNTPFLPWGEEGKVQLLSNGPIDTVTSIIKLSAGTNMDTQAQSVQTVPVPVELSASPQAVEQTTPATSINVEAITQSILHKLKEEQVAIKAEYDADMTRANNLVSDMQQEMLLLKQRLEKAEAEASTYTNHVSRAAQEAEVVHLFSMGAPAVLVNQYTAIRSALESKSQVVKLSQGDTVRESSLIDSVRELLEGALRQTPVMNTQMGLTGGPGEASEGGVKGFLEKVTKENKRKATRVAV
jgi:hypothetical protein